MPKSSKDFEASAYLRLLVLGPAKSGKTRTIISTAIPPVYVINSDDQHAIESAAKVCDFTWDDALGTDAVAIEAALKEARIGVKEGRYKTIVWDTITLYARRVEDVFATPTKNAQGEPDGRRFWPRYTKHLEGILDRLFLLNAHVIVNAHYLDYAGAQIEGQAAKEGGGRINIPGGAARAAVPAYFQNVVFLEKKNGARKFLTSDSGVWETGCRSLPGVEECEPDVSKLWKMMRASGSERAGKGTKK